MRGPRPDKERVVEWVRAFLVELIHEQCGRERGDMKAKGFSKALLYHLQWKVQLRKFLDGRGDFSVEDLSFEGCKFGRWLCSDEITQYASSPEIRELEKWQTELLEIAKRVYDLKIRGKVTAAQRELRKVEPISMKLSSLLTTLKTIHKN